MPANESSNPNDLTLQRWLPEQWCARLGQSIESMTGSPVSVEVAGDVEPSSIPSGQGGFLGWKQSLNIGAGAAIWAGAPGPAWTAIGDAVLKSAGLEEASEDDIRGSYLEILNQALGGMAQAITGLARREVLCTDGQDEATPGEGYLTKCRIAFADGSGFEAFICFEQTLIAALGALGQASSTEGSGTSDQGANGQTADEPETRRTIDLIYDVELPLSISFGRAHMPLKEVLKLTSGSIVELNRAVTEPVEVIVNNCVIARGEVVVVEGNYGIRIVQIVSRRERLRTLH